MKDRNSTVAGNFLRIVGATIVILFHSACASMSVPLSSTTGYSPDQERIAELQLQDKKLASDFQDWAQSIQWDRSLQLTQTGHSSFVFSVDVTPDGSYALSASSDTTLKLWDLTSGRELRVFQGHEDWVLSGAVSPDGRYALSGSRDTSVRLWDMSNGDELARFDDHDGVVEVVAFLPDGKRFVSADRYGAIIVWDVESGEALQTLWNNGAIFSLAVSPDGDYLIAGTESGRLVLWDLAEGEWIVELKGHEAQVRSLAFSPDGREAVSGDADGRILLWDLMRDSQVRELPGHEDAVNAVSFSSDGSRVLSGSEDSTGQMWDREEERIVQTFDARGGSVNDLLFLSGDGQILVGSWARVILWDGETGDELASLEGEGSIVTTIAISPEGTSAIIGTFGWDAFLIDLASGDLIHLLEGHEGGIIAADFSPNGQRLITSSRDGTSRVWDATSGSMLRTLYGHTDSIRSQDISSDGKLLVTGSDDGSARVWDLERGETIVEFTAHGEAITSLALTPDGTRVLSGSLDNTVKLWDAQSGEVLLSYEAHEVNVWTVALSPDGRYGLSGSVDGEIHLWDVASGREELILDRDRSAVLSVQFSPDGKRIIAGTDDNQVKIWEVSSGRQIQSLEGHRSQVNTLAISKDGKTLISGSDDTTLKIWDPNEGAELYSILTSWYGASLLWTPEGYFGGDSRLARESVYFVNGFESVSLDQLFERYYRPDVIEGLFAGVQALELVQDSPVDRQVLSPPQVHIEILGSQASSRGLSVLGVGNEVVDASSFASDQGTIQVRVLAQDQGGGVQNLRLFHNGTRLAQASRGLSVQGTGANSGNQAEDGGVEALFTIALVDGINELSAFAESRNQVKSLEALRRIRYQRPEPTVPRMWVLALGVDRYQGRVPDLDYAVADANGFAQQLAASGQELFEDVQVSYLFDDQVSVQAMEAELERISSLAGPEDVFVLFYAGHGIPVETREQGLEFNFVLPRENLSETQFVQMMEMVPVSKKLYVIDACHASATSDGFFDLTTTTRTAIDAMARAAGSALIAASRADQLALELPDLGQGALTYALIRGLEGEAALAGDLITPTMLRAYAGVLVPQIAQRYGGQQEPGGFVYGIDFPLGSR